MTITPEFGGMAHQYLRNGPDVPYREPTTSQPDEETPSLQVATLARRVRTGKHLPGFGFAGELEQAVKPHTGTLTALDVLNNDPTLRTIGDTLQHIREPLDAVDDLERFLKKTGLYQVQKMMGDLNRPFRL